MFSIQEICDLAIKIEKNGEMFYRDALKKQLQSDLRSLFQLLADDERKHREWFAAKKGDLNPDAGAASIDGMESDLLQDILGDQTFSLKEADLSKIEKIEDLLGLAIEFERDTILFYEMIQTFVQTEEIKEKLNAFIEEENRHIRLLRQYGETEVGPA